MSKLFTIIFILFSSHLYAQKEVLLIGTFHFNNPGYDVVKTKTFDVMSPQSQKQLEVISNKIKTYHPDKIFVEWEFDQQQKLDTLFNLYLNDSYFEYVSKKYPKSTFYVQNEIIQLAFRTAKKLGHKKVYAIDYPYAGDFPFDSLMNEISKAKQLGIKNKIESMMVEMSDKLNLDRDTKTLTQMLLENNTSTYRSEDIGAYLSLFNRGGSEDNFVGAHINAEWYKRNLFMYSLLQKKIESADKKVMVLLGSGHVTLFKDFISKDSYLKAVELRTILNK